MDNNISACDNISACVNKVKDLLLMNRAKHAPYSYVCLDDILPLLNNIEDAITGKCYKCDLYKDYQDSIIAIDTVCRLIKNCNSTDSIITKDEAENLAKFVYSKAIAPKKLHEENKE